LALPRERLWVTVFDTDEEAFDLWVRDIGVEAARVVRLGPIRTFGQWARPVLAGLAARSFTTTGRGGRRSPGSREADGDRYVEIWNLVFMQYARAATAH